MRLHGREASKNLTPEMALQILREGNGRFVNNLKINRNLLEQVNETANGQYPFAIVLSCIDSRTSAELIFDQGLGDIFSVRIAGNIVNQDIIASMEYACCFAGSKLILVLGHTNCGAIQSAYNNVDTGCLSVLLKKIKPAIESIKKENRANIEYELISEKIARENVRLSMLNILEGSSVLKNMVDNKKIGLVGGIYYVNTGVVDIIDKN